MEARVGIEPSRGTYLKFVSCRQNASYKTYAANIGKIAGFCSQVKPEHCAFEILKLLWHYSFITMLLAVLLAVKRQLFQE